MYTSFDNVGLLKVLRLLKSHKSEFLSGQDLSDVLKISRVAIWKHVKKIRSEGYTIKSKQNLGYKLLDNTERLLPWEITENLNTKFIGKRIYYFDSIDSTQNFAIKIAPNKNENGTVVISKKQTLGRGRLKRKWKSPVGGIWLSVIVHPKFRTSQITLVPIAISLALHKAIEKVLGIKTALKWPNDLTLKKKKVAGILYFFKIGKARSLTFLNASSNVTATATSVDCEPAAAGRWTDIGSSDQTVYGIAVTNSATAGVARVVVNYIQARDLS